MRPLDLRSDTVTRPTPAMRRAMADAEVGDDQMGEDPTVRLLEEASAAAVGKEAGAFMASGIMGNLCSVLAQTHRGDELIAGELSHLVQNEAGAYAVFGGLHPRAFRQDVPAPRPADLEALVRPQGIQFARTALLCLENTHNWLSGQCVTVAEMDALGTWARARGLAVHLDGARIFNAAVALGVPAPELTRQVDTVQFCFSKGLCAPVGSVVCGSRAVIEKVKKARKMVGGAMRQSGVLAAAALVGLETMRDRLADDHALARALADGLANTSGIAIDASKVQTNIVAFQLASGRSGEKFRDGCLARGLKLSCYGGDWSRLRAVTHHDVGPEEIAAALSAVAAAVKEA